MDEIEEDVIERAISKDNAEEEVLSYVENGVIWFKIDVIISKLLVTKKVKKTLLKSNKSLKIVTKLDLKENHYLVGICGEDRNKVIETKMKLNLLLSLSKRQRPFTHLITVPFNCEPLRQEFSRFRDNVLTNFKDYNGIDEHLFQTPFKLHLTLCVLVLLDQNEILSAKRALKQCFNEIVRPVIEDKPLKVSVEGLDVMKGHPNRAHVIYAQIRDESNRLQTIANQTLKQFIKSGLLEDSTENSVKLHITFMNSLFRQRILSKTYPKTIQKRIKREAFDAKAIIDSYNSYKFCETVIESIQLNDIKTRTEDGFYGLVESIDFPKE